MTYIFIERSVNLIVTVRRRRWRGTIEIWKRPSSMLHPLLLPL